MTMCRYTAQFSSAGSVTLKRMLMWLPTRFIKCVFMH